MALAGNGDVDFGTLAEALLTPDAATCVLTVDDLVRCWGEGVNGILGYSTPVNIGDDETPAQYYSSLNSADVELPGKVAQLVSGTQHVCALLVSQAVYCWGLNGVGQLGLGTVAAPLGKVGDDETPSSVGPVPLGNFVATHIYAGGMRTCVQNEAGDLRCWGAGGVGQLGYPGVSNIGDTQTPGLAWAIDANMGDIELGGPIVHLSMGAAHSCAILENGEVRCWGLGNGGRLGYGNTDNIGDDEPPGSGGPVDFFDPL